MASPAAQQHLVVSHQISNAATGDGDEEQSMVTTHPLPLPLPCRLPLKKRKFSAPWAAHEGDDRHTPVIISENTSSISNPSGTSVIVSPAHTSSEGVSGVSSSSDAADTTHPQPVHGDNFNMASSNKKPRTGAAATLEKNFIKNYVMSRDYNALTPVMSRAQHTMIDFMQIQSDVSHHRFKCKKCNKSFPTFQALGGHRTSHYAQTKEADNLPDYKFKCKTCNKSFPTFQALGGHRSSHYEETNKDTKISSSQDDNEIVGDHRCNICNKSFPTGRALGGHKRLHWAKPFPVQASADASYHQFPIQASVDAGLSASHHQTGQGDDGINLELTL